jgi:5'-3' exonuclease, N-terminal resolvase-like domain
LINNTKLLFDADVLKYRLAFSCEGLSEETEVIGQIVTLVDAIVQWLDPFGLIPDNNHYFYLTGKSNFRYDIAKSHPYKGNRTSPKPQWLNFIENYFISNYKAIMSEGEEADDLIAKECAANNYENVVVISTDKDFGQLPVTIFNPTKFEITRNTPWEATKYFYEQILTGDTVDNIKGIYGIGPVKAKAILDGCDNEIALYNAVEDAYAIDMANHIEYQHDHLSSEALERVLENGRLLWLRRYDNQIWNPPSV